VNVHESTEEKETMNYYAIMIICCHQNEIEEKAVIV
jgi:hypothetical protein